MIDPGTETIVVDGYFDGLRHHGRGPYTIALRDGRIAGVTSGLAVAAAEAGVRRAAYAMPGLVEAHSHLFLDGGQTDPDRRAAHLGAPRARLLDVGRASLRQSLAAGITLVRDAGDIHGINVELRGESERSPLPSPRVRCPGVAIRKAGRYGSFMAREVGPACSIESLMASIAPQADEFKLLLTGVIDFEAGAVKGAPQFDVEEALRIASTARSLRRRTFVHCSGSEGIAIALQANFDSIEHGFFVSRAQLQLMAERRIAWVPTFSPVHAQWAAPQIAGWSAPVVGQLRRILDQHAESLVQAHALGVPVMPGSDAGSPGVPHGQGLLDEIERMSDAGMATEPLLAAATSLPRATWGLEGAGIERGARAELVLLGASPLADRRALRDVRAVYCRGWYDPAAAACARPGPIAS